MSHNYKIAYEQREVAEYLFTNFINKTKLLLLQTKYEPIKIIIIYGIYNNNDNVDNSKNCRVWC